MNTLQKIALSLLITVIIFSIFVFFAFTGLFSNFELGFFNKRIQEINKSELHKKIEDISLFHRQYINRFDSILEEMDVQKIYTSQWDEEYIVKFHNLIKLFEEEYKGIQFIWFYDNKLQIHYSSADFAEKNNSGIFRKVYKNVKEASADIIDFNILNENNFDKPEIVLDNTYNQIVYKFPAIDKLNVRRGTAVLIVSVKDLRRYLIEKNSLNIDGKISIFDNGYIFGKNFENVSEFSNKNSQWEDILSDSTRIYRDNITGKEYILLSEHIDSLGNVAELFNLDDYKLDKSLKYFLLLAFFISSYLLIFLILNIKQDKIVIINSRIKRLQSQFLKEYLQNHENLDINQWQRKIHFKGDIVKNEIRRGIGKIKKSEAEKVDHLIDQSWNELMELIDTRIKQTSSGSLEISNLEDILKKVIETAPSLVAGQTVAGQTLNNLQNKKINRASSAEVKENLVDELEELDEIESVSDDMVPELAEGEEMEEISELAEGEEVEEIPELAEGEEMEEIPELAEGDEIESVADDMVSAHVESEEIELLEVDDSDYIDDISKDEDNDFFKKEKNAAVIIEQVSGFDKEVYTNELNNIGKFVENFKKLTILEIEKEVLGQISIENIINKEENTDIYSKLHKLEEIPINKTLDNKSYLIDENEEKLENLSVIPTNSDNSIYNLEQISEDFGLYSIKNYSYKKSVQGSLELADTNLSGEEGFMMQEVSGDINDNENIEIKDTEEFEELEELEELEDCYNLDGSIIDRIEKLKSGGFAEIKTFESQSEQIDSKQAVSMADGVFQINDEVYNTTSIPDNFELKELVDSVSPSKENKADNEYVNILDLVDVDLPFFGSKNVKPKKRKPDGDIFIDSRYNYDRFRSKFKKNNIGIVQSLMKITQEFDAVFGGLLVFGNNGWRMEHSLGFNGKSVKRFIFSSDEDFSREIFEKKKYFLLKRGKSGIDEVDSRLFEGDLSYMRGSLFIPVLFNKNPAYLYLGLKNIISISDCIEKLQNI